MCMYEFRCQLDSKVNFWTPLRGVNICFWVHMEGGGKTNSGLPELLVGSTPHQ